MNRKFVDEFAVEFCMTMNFKGNRARLARALFNVDKNRYTHWGTETLNTHTVVIGMGILSVSLEWI